MAIVKEYYTTRDDGVELYRTYSDQDFLIRKVETDEIYSEAIDISTTSYEYEETNIPIENDEITDSEALAIIRGEVE